jgi:hypothetical protein
VTEVFTVEIFEEYLREIGYSVQLIHDSAATPFTSVGDVEVPAGPLRGKKCDIAIQRINTVPYTVPAAIHTRPALVPMSPGPPLGTQASPLGAEWQYWSRRYDRIPTAHGIWAHVLGILSNVVL